MELNKIKIKDFEIKVSVDASGVFTLSDETGVQWAAPSLKEATAMATKDLADRRKSVMSIPATHMETRASYNRRPGSPDVTYTSVTVTGIHLRTGGFLCRDRHNKALTITQYGDYLFHPLTADDVKAYEALKRVQKDAERAVNQWERDHRLTIAEVKARLAGQPFTTEEEDTDA